MKRIKIMGLAIVAVFALSAGLASVASAALPEFSPEGGSFPVAFTVTSGPGTLATVGGREVHCTSDQGSGEISSAKVVKNVITRFLGCTASGPFGTKLSCKSSKATEEGEIETLKVIGNLVYDTTKTQKEKGEKGKAALVGEPQEGGLYTKFECGGLQTIEVKGTSLGLITPVNTKTKLLTVEAKLSSGKPVDSEWEMTNGALLTVKTETKGSGFENFGFEESGLEGKEDLLPTVNVEVKA